MGTESDGTKTSRRRCGVRSFECQMKRLNERHAGTGIIIVDVMEQMVKLYEPATDDEESAFNVIISEDMSRNDVIEEVLQILQNL